MQSKHLSGLYKKDMESHLFSMNVSNDVNFVNPTLG